MFKRIAFLVIVIGATVTCAVFLFVRRNPNPSPAQPVETKTPIERRQKRGEAPYPTSQESVTDQHVPQQPTRDAAETHQAEKERTESLANVSVADLERMANEAMKRRAYDKAVPLLNQALRQTISAEERTRIVSSLADALARTQDFDGAEECLRELQASATGDDGRVSAAIRLANLHALQGDYEVAEHVLEDTALVGTDEFDHQKLQSAQMHIWQLQPERMNQVASNLQARVDADPSDISSLKQLGTIYLRYQRDHEKAKPIYEMMFEQNPTNPAIQNVLISIYQKTHDFQRAKAVYQSYLKEHPDEADGIHYQIATLDLKSGRGDDAVEYAKLHLAGADATAEQLKLVARICEQGGRFEDSLLLLGRAEENADSEETRMSIRFQRVDLLNRQRRYDDAEKIVRQIVADFGQDSNVKARANKELFRIYQLQGKMGEIEL